MERIDMLKVASKSDPKKVAGAIANLLPENQTVQLQAIGAGAVNQAIKAIAISRGFVAPSGINLICIPAFSEVEINGKKRTAIKLIVKSR